MPFPGAMIGRSTDPVTQAIDTEWLTVFATAVGSGSTVGHPLFPVCIEWPAVIAAARLDDGVLRGEERRRGIHATHDLTIHRLAQPGDVVTTTATVDALETRRRGTWQRLRIETHDADGARVATTVMGSMFPGVSIAGAIPDARTPQAAAADTVVPRDVETIAIDVTATQAHDYSEASRIWNPIHTDTAAALAAGLDAPILHGTCTVGLATTAAIAWAGADPTSLHRIRARFAGMVAMPSTLELRVWRASAVDVRFEVVAADHKPVLRDGRLDFRP